MEPVKDFKELFLQCGSVGSHREGIGHVLDIEILVTPGLAEISQHLKKASGSPPIVLWCAKSQSEAGKDPCAVVGLGEDLGTESKARVTATADIQNKPIFQSCNSSLWPMLQV